MKDKINESICIIRETNAKFENPCIMWAGGKDSTVMLHLTREALLSDSIHFPVVFIDTSYQFRETLDFIRMLTEAWNINLIRVRNDKALYEGVGPEHNTFLCCSMLKTLMINQVIIDNEFDAVLTGIRWDELEERGKEYQYSVRDIPMHMRVHPILSWSEQNVWDYIKKYDIPYNPLYDKGYRSIGCWPCTKPAEEFEREGREMTDKKMERLRALGYL